MFCSQSCEFIGLTGEQHGSGSFNVCNEEYNVIELPWDIQVSKAQICEME